MAQPRSDITRLLLDWSGGNQAALESLFPLVYDELRAMAQLHLRRERSAHTLQRTALVHEAFLRLVDQKNVDWQSRAQFFGLASQMMRRILVDYARKRSAAKRGSNAVRVDLEEMERGHTSARASAAAPTGAAADDTQLDFGAFDEVLTRLEKLEPRQGKLVELRFFGGLSLEEAAEVIGVSRATVKRDWVFARAWLQRELSDHAES
ncbi:MAG TPA: sigma-70 family RNA polymerase sigma factor [Steroidobacteraceae bacterium]|nr:sigma-70 family RNA polymerase sigma factor [Steroidobacteraceae bacterium]